MMKRSQNNRTDLELTFLGQMGLRIQHGDSVLYIDPFLSPHRNRQVTAPMGVENLCDADLILGTHDHKDHIDRDAWPVYAGLSRDAIFVVPEFVLQRNLSNDLGIPPERFVGLTHGQHVCLGGVGITAVASAHEFLDRDPDTGLFPYLGYVVEIGGYTLYHAGDTCRYEGLETTLSKWRFDLMMLPINGRDAKRYSTGYVGNMTFQEAVDLAGMLEPRLVVPGHYDLFAHNGENPDHFTEYMKAKYPAVSAEIFELGRVYRISK